MVSRFNQFLDSIRINELPRRRVSRVAPDTPLEEVYRRLAEERSVAVLVEEDGRLVGIFTERDVLNRTALEGGRERPVSEVMIRDVVTLGPAQHLADAVHIMTARRIRHVPLVNAEGRAVGMIGGRDVLRLIAEYFPETLLNLPPRLDQTLSQAEGG